MHVISTPQLRKVILLALELYLPQEVRRAQRMQAVYSGTVVRGDCNWEITQRIAVWDSAKKKWERPYTALSAWMAVDGSAYQPATPLAKEDIRGLLSDLDPVVDMVKEARLDAGLSYEQAVFVAHSTDTHTGSTD